MSWAPRVKICGLRRREDVAAAAAAGADYVGFVLAGGPRHVAPLRARPLHEDLEGPEGRSGPLPVAVFVDESPAQVRAASAAAGARIVQLHGSEPPEACEELREAGLAVWKALRPRSEAELQSLVDRYAGVVDALHVEGWSDSGSGGTGTAFPWEWLEAVRARGALPSSGRSAPRERGVPAPLASGYVVPSGPALILAGGLSPANVAEAVRRLRPDAVDVSSGVEVRPGVKDPALVRAFVAEVRRVGWRESAGESGGVTGREPAR